MSTQTEDTNARIYPCKDCGKMRSKAEGGTTFTVCDACWDKHFKPSQTEDLEAQAIGEQTPVAWCVAYDGPGANEGRRVHSNPTMYKPEAEELAKRTGLVVVSLYPSPLSPEARDMAIEAVNELIRTHNGFHQAIKHITGLPYPWDPWDAAMDKWGQALSALRGE